MGTSFTKKRTIIIALALVIIGLGYYYVHKRLDGINDEDTVMAYRSQSNALLGNAEWLSFDMQWEQYSQGDLLWTMTHHVILHYSHNQDMVFVDDPFHYKYFKITKSSADIIDEGENKIITYERKFGGQYTDMGVFQHLGYYNEYLWYYMMPFRNRFVMPSMFDLNESMDLYNGTDSLREYVGHGGKGYITTDSTRKEVTHEIYSYVNNNTNVLDSIRINYLVDNEISSQRIIRISNLRFDNRQQHVDSLFNLDSPKYAKYSHHDEKNPKSPWTGNHDITEEVLRFPLVKLNGDTVTLAENDGWVLLNVWTINCGPCIENLQNYGHEKDSLGYRVLEHEGIKIMAVNQSSDNMELIRSIGEKAGTTDLMYSGKGLSGVIELPYLGYYYLISPDKQIAYESDHLGDYSELLEAKANYEKQKGK